MEMPAAMKVARGCWEQEPTSLSLGCKRLRPLAPKLTAAAATATATKSFIRPESGPRKPGSSDSQKKLECTQVESGQGGGTRWNPTQEQIGILEMLYKGGMRTPNAQQIEHITAQLDKYGKIEGKNVFYWFQNHKARERQKLKRTSLGLTHTPRTPPNSTLHHYCVSQKRKCRSWPFDQCHEEDNSSYSCTNEDEDEDEEEEEEEDRTLKLFPLHPERR